LGPYITESIKNFKEKRKRKEEEGKIRKAKKERII